MKKKLVGLFLVLAMLVGYLPTVVWAAFSPRTTAPSSNNQYYYSNLNYYYSIGYGMPNCTAYAYGRAYEILGSKPNLCPNMAGQWWYYNQENGYYPSGQEPKLGAIACWWDGGWDGTRTGHVAVVEGINGNTVSTSNSGYNSSNFWMQDRNKNSMNYTYNGKTYTFLGYIYILPDDTTPPTVTNFYVSNISSSSFTINCTANETLSRAYVIVYNSNYPNGKAFNIYDINSNSFNKTIKTVDYGGTGEYAVSVYIWDISGNEAVVKSGHFNTSGLNITNCTVSNINNSTFTINCTVNTAVSRAYVIVYNSKYPNGQAFNIYNINKSSFNTTINVDDYGGIGEYAVNIYVFDAIGNEAVGKTGHFNVPIIQSTPIPSTLPPATVPFTIEKNYGYAKIKNNTNQPYDATIILAKYNDGTFEDSLIISTTFAANEERTVYTDYGNNYKIFVWDSLSGMKPLAE